MKKVSLLTVAVALLVALTAGVAVAKTFQGTNGPNTIKGTVAADIINGFGGADNLSGNPGPDKINGGQGVDMIKGGYGNDRMTGGTEGDNIQGNFDNDEAFGGPGNDTIGVNGDTGEDFVNCGEGPGTMDRDIARVDENDAVDNTTASTLVTSEGLSCEVIFVGGVRLPERPPAPTP